VDILLPLSTVKPTDTQFGEWVNVIGYVTEGSSTPGSNGGDKKNAPKAGERVAARVQAIVLWSAGAVNIGEYEKVLEDRLEAEKRRKAH
jgi:Telomere capping, CST complex subunit